MVAVRPHGVPDPADRDLGTSSAPAPADQGPAYLIGTPADLAGSLRDRTNRQLDDGDIDTVDADYYFKLADLCEQKNVWPIISPTKHDWFGFGEVEPLFESHDDDTYWVSLVDAGRVSGMTDEAIWAMFLEDQADGYGDMADLEWLTNDEGDKASIPIVAHSFLLRAMLHGPWSKEFMTNTMGLFRRAVVKSGLGDKIAPVVVVKDGVATETDMTFSDFLNAGEGLPSEEDAVEKAFRGPLGGAL